MYKSYNANFVDMTSNRCEGLAWSQGVSQRIVCTTRSHTVQSTSHHMVTEASQRCCSNFQTLRGTSGVVGICVFIFRFTMPWPLRPLAAIYPCCMLACLCSVIVFTPHLLLLPPSYKCYPAQALVGRFIFELPAKHLGWQAMELDRCCDCFVWFLPPPQLHKGK